MGVKPVGDAHYTLSPRCVAEVLGLLDTQESVCDAFGQMTEGLRESWIASLLPRDFAAKVQFLGWFFDEYLASFGEDAADQAEWDAMFKPLEEQLLRCLAVIRAYQAENPP